MGPVLLLAVIGIGWPSQSAISYTLHGHTSGDTHRLGVGTLGNGVFS